jgi:hypothetical protein
MGWRTAVTKKQSLHRSSQVGGKSADGQDTSLGSVKEAMNRAKALK